MHVSVMSRVENSTANNVSCCYEKRKMCTRESQWILTCFCYCLKRHFASLQHKVVIFYVKSHINGNISILNKSIMWKRTRLIKLNYFSCEVLCIILVSTRDHCLGKNVVFLRLGSSVLSLCRCHYCIHKSISAYLIM